MLVSSAGILEYFCKLASNPNSWILDAKACHIKCVSGCSVHSMTRSIFFGEADTFQLDAAVLSATRD